MFYETEKNDHNLPFNPFKSCVVPRPIGWISTLSHDNVPNLAPFSMFNQLGYDPPMVFFSGSCRPETGDPKDSVRNAEETGEFVANMATYELREKLALSAELFDPDVDEFEAVGLKKLPSRLVAPPRVEGSPVHLECVYHATLTLPAYRRDTIHRVVVGRVVGIHVDDDFITPEGQLDILKIRPLSRMGYLQYTSVTETFSIVGPNQYTDVRGKTGDAVAKPTPRTA